MNRVKSRAPPQFKRQVQDTEKRLNILFDHLNNDEGLSRELLNEMVQLASAIANKDYQTAYGIHIDLLTTKTEECGHWMTGVKRLIEMGRSTP